MKITILIKHNLNKIYNILKKLENNSFLSKFSKTIDIYDDKNWNKVFKKSLKNKGSKIFVIDEDGYVPFMFYSKQKGISVAFPHNADAAKLARAHNNSRVCVIAYNNTKKLDEIFKAYLTTKFEGGRHATRVNIMHNSFKKANTTVKFNAKSKTVVICCDHAGFKIKESIKAYLHKLGYKVIDVGTNSLASTHYSMFAIAAGLVANNNLTIIGVCYTGAGICNTLNKFKGINACICITPAQAKIAKMKKGANAISIAAKYIKQSDINKTIKAFLDAKQGKIKPEINKLGFNFDKKVFNKIRLSSDIVVPTKLK